jgi:hypothetical protein
VLARRLGERGQIGDRRRRLGVAAARGVAFAMQVILEQPVDQQVRIAADRRGEVQVVARCQAEVADRHGVPHRLGQRAQDEERQRLRAWLLGDLIEHVLHAERRHRLLDIDRDAVRAEQLGEQGDAVGLGRRVDPPHRRRAALPEEVADRLVGRDHEFLDELVGLLDRGVALGLDHVADQARIVGVEHDLGLGDLEVERAARLALLAKLARQRVEPRQLARPLSVLLAAAAEVALERSGDAGIVESRLAADHGSGVADVG